MRFHDVQCMQVNESISTVAGLPLAGSGSNMRKLPWGLRMLIGGASFPMEKDFFHTIGELANYDLRRWPQRPLAGSPIGRHLVFRQCSLRHSTSSVIVSVGSAPPAPSTLPLNAIPSKNVPGAFICFTTRLSALRLVTSNSGSGHCWPRENSATRPSTMLSTVSPTVLTTLFPVAGSTSMESTGCLTLYRSVDTP